MMSQGAQTLPLAESDLRQRASRAARMRRRHRSERRFRLYGVCAILTALGFLAMLFISIIGNGWTAFLQTSVKLAVKFDETVIDPSGERNDMELRAANYQKLAREALLARLGVSAEDRVARSRAFSLLSRGAALQLRDMVLADPGLIGRSREVWLLASDNTDALMKGSIKRETPEDRRQLSDQQIGWIDQLHDTGALDLRFNKGLFAFGASSQPETSGVGVAVIGSLFMMFIVVILAVPLGVAAAIYLEEFAPKTFWTDLVEVNINNLAAVPSIVFGLLGLSVFINFFGMPRSASLVGGLVLALMTLPTIIIATRAAIRAVPPSIREAAYGVGASKMQTVFQHVAPLAMPGIMTGTIIGLVQALGETAPLIMIGLVAFVADYPTTPMEPATALPVQIYMWATAAERGFIERTAGATIILLGFLVLMNATAIVLRKRFEKKW